MQYSYRKCDRCGEKINERECIGPIEFQVPDGHHTRVDVWEPLQRRDLCNMCLGSYRDWWVRTSSE